MHLWISANALGLGLILLTGGWIEAVGIKEFDAYNFKSLSSYTVIFAGLVLGLLQWKVISQYRLEIPLRWILGTAIGFWTISVMEAFFYEMSIWANFNRLSTDEQNLLRNVDAARTAGVIGGAVLGLFQGWSPKVRLLWAIVNSVGWAVGWAVSRGINYKAHHALLYFPEAPQSLRMVVQMGVLGLVAGFVSSVITGIPLLILLRREWMRS